MDFIERIKKNLSDSELKSPLFDIHFDSENNIVGYIADEFFEDKSDEESQQLIWKLLKNHFTQKELLDISTIFHETPTERSMRLGGESLNRNRIRESNFWLHVTPNLSKYWLFIDIRKIDDNYKAIFIIINEKENFKREISFTYNKEIIEFMELSSEDEIKKELYFNTFNKAEAAIKFHLMTKYEELTEKGRWGRANIFSYVFNDFKIKPILKKELIFNEKEILILSKDLSIIDNFKIKKELADAIKISKTINELSNESVV